MGQVIRVDFSKPPLSVKRKPRCSHARKVLDEQEGGIFCATCGEELDALSEFVAFVRMATPILERVRDLVRSGVVQTEPVPTERLRRRSRRYR